MPKPAFAKALETLQGGLFLLALDDCVDSVTDSANDPLSSSSESAMVAKHLWHGNISHSANRWWDKSMQVVLVNIGKTSSCNRMGYIGEHSMADGMPATGVWEHLLTQTKTIAATPTNNNHN
jgi:hypothetical protein